MDDLTKNMRRALREREKNVAVDCKEDVLRELHRKKTGSDSDHLSELQSRIISVVKRSAKSFDQQNSCPFPPGPRRPPKPI